MLVLQFWIGKLLKFEWDNDWQVSQLTTTVITVNYQQIFQLHTLAWDKLLILKN